MKREFLVFVVVGVVLLAGCSGGSDSSSSPEASPSPSMTEVSPTDAGSTPTPAEGTSTTSEASGPELRAIDRATVNERHAAAVERLDNFSVRLTVNVSGTASLPGLPNQQFTFVAYVDREADTSHQVLSRPTENLRVEVAQGPSGKFMRVARNGSVAYQEAESDLVDRDRLIQPVQQHVAGSFRFQDMGTVETENGVMQRYVATENTTTQDAKAMYGGEITDAEIEILVDPDSGLITAYRTSVTVESDGVTTITYVVDFFDVNSTSVSAPGWLDEAKEATES